MGTSGLFLAIVAASSMGAVMPGKDVQKQNTVFQRYWGTEFVWKFDELPRKAVVPKFRIPYSGHIYPDAQGGTASALSKYDRAFNGGRHLATAYEKHDTSAFKERARKNGLFGGRFSRMVTPHWHGHCNGWTAAAIRHAEPQQSVRHNGVAFTRADVKALLAEIYIYNDAMPLAGMDSSLNAGTFHAIIANWVGRGAHPVGMEADPTEEKWNYPIYSYAASSAKHSERRVEVNMNIAYAKDSDGEYDESPRIKHVKSFHYMLTLNANGEIVGGHFYPDSSIIDFLWIPMKPKQGGQEGNERGCPHVDVNKVLAIWRASVPEDVRKKWPVIDPPKADRVLEIAGLETLMPVQDPDAAKKKSQVAGTENVDAEAGDTDSAPGDTSTPQPDDLRVSDRPM